MSDIDRKANRNVYSDAATRNEIRLVGIKSGQLGTIRHCLIE